MLVDGRVLARDLLHAVINEVSHLDVKPHLTVFTCAPNFETKKYLDLKVRRAKKAGVGINVIELPISCTTEDVVQSVTHAVMQTDGIIVQQPLPGHIDTNKVLAAIPLTSDADGAHYDGSDRTPIHPVAGAFAEILGRHDVLLAGQNVVVVGAGRLVGAPAAIWAKSQGASVTVITKDTVDNEVAIANADVLITGAGQPGLIKKDMVKPGVIVLDAGTSESNGQLVGDVDPEVAEIAALFTPVPGGVGPLTVAVLLQNVLHLAQDGQS